MFAPRFTPEVPPPAPGLSFLLVEMGEFALNRAAWARNFTRVKQLVEAGHDVNQRTPEGTTPLMGAVSEGQAAMCQYLIERGADVTVRLPSSGWGTDNWSLLRLARKDGTSTVVKLLEEAGAPE
jgi:ankyrin repeat protein